MIDKSLIKRLYVIFGFGLIVLFGLAENYLWHSGIFLSSFEDSFIVLDDLAEGTKNGAVLIALFAVFFSFSFHVLSWLATKLYLRSFIVKTLIILSRIFDVSTLIIVAWAATI